MIAGKGCSIKEKPVEKLVIRKKNKYEIEKKRKKRESRQRGQR